MGNHCAAPRDQIRIFLTALGRGHHLNFKLRRVFDNCRSKVLVFETTTDKVYQNTFMGIPTAFGSL